MDVKDLRIGMLVSVNDCETPYPLQVVEIRRISGSYYAELYNEEHNKRLTCIVDKINCEVQSIDESSLDKRARDYVDKNSEGCDFVNWHIGSDELEDAYKQGFIDGRAFYCKKQYNLCFSDRDMFDNLRFGARFKTRSGIDAIFLFKNGRFLNFVIDKKTRDELYLEEIVTDLKGFVDNPNHPCDNDIVERIY